jgi:succinate dehydrogenase/fumarate reductase flavoprotein subunit
VVFSITIIQGGSSLTRCAVFGEIAVKNAAGFARRII